MIALDFVIITLVGLMISTIPVNLVIRYCSNCSWHISMLYCDRIDVSKGDDVNKPMHHVNVLVRIIKVNIRFQSKVCDGCYDLLLWVFIAVIFNDVAIVSINGNDYRIHF